MRWPVVLALSLVLNLVGCSLFGTSDPITDLRAYVSTEVQDPDRRTKMLSEVDLFEKRLDEFGATMLRLGEEMNAANRDYNRSEEAFATLFAKHNTARTKARDGVLKVLIRFRSLATAAEWEDIADSQIGEYRKRVTTTAISTK